MQAGIVFPNQLFNKSTFLQETTRIFLIEEHLFFRQFLFHKQKLAFHRASMKFYQKYLLSKGCTVEYITAQEELSDIRKLIPHLAKEGIKEIHFYEPIDDWLERRIQKGINTQRLEFKKHYNPSFLLSQQQRSDYFENRSSFFQADFYKKQRVELGILMEGDNSPEGGKWSFDKENRKKYPKGKTPPMVLFPEADHFYNDAVLYIQKHFADNPGELSSQPLYPYTFEQSKTWLQQFLDYRFAEFGTYEDAIVAEADILHHSVLSPLLNCGLLTPDYVIDQILAHARSNSITINNTEGFIRQIIGWREYIAGVYLAIGRKERTLNYWNFSRKLPQSFYDGTTGILPFDNVIKKTMNNAYLHHIERLMIAGNFMLLCEIDPDEVYTWFMELFIDAYDWVMVPNVYGMSQFADGGLMATKPYISGSNYILKMSNYKKGDWTEIWDGLFWRFMHVHREKLQKNPRLGMLIRNFDRMDEKKRGTLLKNAENFLAKL